MTHCKNYTSLTIDCTLNFYNNTYHYQMETKNKLSIVALSDLHGLLPEITSHADIAILAGDIIPLELQKNMQHSKWWFNNEFADWIKSLPVKKVFMVAGNHDFYLETITKKDLSEIYKSTNKKLVYIMNTTVSYTDKYKTKWRIFGTPYCTRFFEWAFMRDEKTLTKKFENIPDSVDVIITHDPPFAYGDIDIIARKEGIGHVGSRPLAARLKDVDYKLLVCGHIHTGDHSFNEVFRTVNVSILNEQYRKGYEPFYITITK